MASYHTIQQGEYIALIAKKTGFRNWRTIYDHPQNADLRTRRADPNVLFPGDKLYIPDKTPKTESCATGKLHVFKVPAPTMQIQIKLKDRQEGKPFKNTKCILKVSGTEYPLTTDGEGLIQKEVPVGTKTVELAVPKYHLKWKLEVGHLDPLREGGDEKHIVTGVQARLNNLGYHCGEIDGNLGPRTRHALKDFQARTMGRDDADGELDDDTIGALEREHFS
jgi:putative peptidoglycan binding protein